MYIFVFKTSSVAVFSFSRQLCDGHKLTVTISSIKTFGIVSPFLPYSVMVKLVLVLFVQGGRTYELETI